MAAIVRATASTAAIIRRTVNRTRGTRIVGASRGRVVNRGYSSPEAPFVADRVDLAKHTSAASAKRLAMNSAAGSMGGIGRVVGPTVPPTALTGTWMTTWKRTIARATPTAWAK